MIEKNDGRINLSTICSIHVPEASLLMDKVMAQLHHNKEVERLATFDILIGREKTVPGECYLLKGLIELYAKDRNTYEKFCSVFNEKYKINIGEHLNPIMDTLEKFIASPNTLMYFYMEESKNEDELLPLAIFLNLKKEGVFIGKCSDKFFKYREKHLLKSREYSRDEILNNPYYLERILLELLKAYLSLYHDIQFEKFYGTLKTLSIKIDEILPFTRNKAITYLLTCCADPQARKELQQKTSNFFQCFENIASQHNFILFQLDKSLLILFNTKSEIVVLFNNCNVEPNTISNADPAIEYTLFYPEKHGFTAQVNSYVLKELFEREKWTKTFSFALFLKSDDELKKLGNAIEKEIYQKYEAELEKAVRALY